MVWPQGHAAALLSHVTYKLGLRLCPVGSCITSFNVTFAIKDVSVGANNWLRIKGINV